MALPDVSVALSPNSGTLPYTTTATVAAAGGTGANRTYEILDWGDGSTSAPQSAATFTKTIPDQATFTGRTVTARVSENAPTGSYQRAVHLNGPEYGLNNPTGATQPFSQNNLGVYDSAYHYESQASLTYLASRGVKQVKIPIRWERINPVIGGPLSESEMTLLTGCLDRCNTAGLTAIVDIHNYGVYYWDDPAVTGTTGYRKGIGTAEVPVSAFSNVWGLLAARLKTHPAVAAYAIMAEPQAAGGLTQATWKTASQAAVTAIRDAGDVHTIHVSGWDWSITQGWAAVNGAPWIADPAGNVKYEGHHYWDDNTGGGYTNTYAYEVTASQTGGYTAGSYVDAFTNRIMTELDAFQSWLDQYTVKGIIGEFGWPAAESPTLWNALADTYLTRCDEVGLDTVFWSCGEWAFGGVADMLIYKGSPLSTANSQAAVQEAHTLA